MTERVFSLVVMNGSAIFTAETAQNSLLVLYRFGGKRERHPALEK